MIKRRRFPKIFFGWWTVLTGSFISLMIGGFQIYGFSVLFKPISSELGFSRTIASVPAGISRFEGGFSAPLAGWAADKFGPETVVFFGCLSLGFKHGTNVLHKLALGEPLRAMDASGQPPHAFALPPAAQPFL
ncbi:hypothetical protein ACFLUU_03910 [Chloroflexota bacterium]